MRKPVANRSQPSHADPISEIRRSQPQFLDGAHLIESANEDDVTLSLMPDYTRLQLDSADMTHVKTPNPALLAMARGDHVKAPKRRTWFAFGMLTGAFAMWLVIGDVRPAAEAVRSLTTRAAQTIDRAPPPSAPASGPAPAKH